MRRMCTQWFVAVLTVSVAMGLGTAFAAVNNIVVGGTFVCTITHGAGGYTVDQRVNQINERITNVLSVERFRSNPKTVVEVAAMGANALISVGDPVGKVLVMTVTPADATGTGVSAFTLASQWGQKLAQGLGQAMPSSHWNLNYVRP